MMISILIGMAVYYISSVLLFSIKKVGPYPSQRKRVALPHFDDVTKERSFIERPVDLFDHLRLLFGAYSVTKDEDGQEFWSVRVHAMAVWVCPHCLGFWVAFVLAAFFAFWYQDAHNFFLDWWAAAGINSFLVKVSRDES